VLKISRISLLVWCLATY